MKSSVDNPPERCASPASSLGSKTSSFLPFSSSSSKAVNASALSNPVMEKIYETLKDEFLNGKLSKIKGLIKKLTPIEQEKYKQDFYTKLIESHSIEGFLQKLSMKLKDTDLDEMTRKFELFTKFGILPRINLSFDNSGGAQYQSIESPTFYGQFQCTEDNPSVKKVDDLVKIRDYLTSHANSVRFEIDEVNQCELLTEVDSRMSLHARSDNRELYDYGPLQRRLDSLARILSLDSTHSACVAITIYDSQLIISANQAHVADSSLNVAYFRKRIEKVREFLRLFYCGDLLIFKPDHVIDSEIIACFETGGQLYDWGFPYLENLLTQDFKFSVQELYESLNSVQFGGVGTRLEYFIKDAYKLAVTAYMIKHGIEHPNESIVKFVEKKSSPLTPSVYQDSSLSSSPAPSPSPSAFNCLTTIQASYASPKMVFSRIPSRAHSSIYLNGSDSFDFGKEASFCSLSSDLVQEAASTPFSSASEKGDSSSQRGTPIPLSNRASSPVFIDDSMRINIVKASPSPQGIACYSVTPTPLKQSGVENTELRQITSEEFMVLLGLTNSSNITYLSPVLENDDVYMLIREDCRSTKIMSLGKHQGSISDIHAEQLIMVGYLERYKQADLSDLAKMLVHIGLSKFACSTCDEVKSQFPAVVFTGRSQVSFPCVVNLKTQPEQFFQVQEYDEKSCSTLRSTTPKPRRPKTPQTPVSCSSRECMWGRRQIQEQAGFTAGPVSPMLSPASKKAKFHQNLPLTELRLAAGVEQMDISSNPQNSSSAQKSLVFAR